VNAFAGKDLEGIKFWDNHAGFSYVGPQDVNLLDHWRNAGVNYLSVNVAYDAVPWAPPFAQSPSTPEELRRGRTSDLRSGARRIDGHQILAGASIPRFG
jgi:hypothetical protein